MIEFTTIKLTLEQEALVRAAELDIDNLDPEELRVCLKLAARNDLIKTSMIKQLAEQLKLLQQSHPQVARRVRRNGKLVGRVQ